MPKTFPPEILPVHIMYETPTVSASIHERHGPHGRYYFAEVAHQITRDDGVRINTRMFSLDELPALSELANRAYKCGKTFESRPARDTPSPNFVN